MRRIGLSAWFLAVAMLASGPSALLSDDAPKLETRAEAVDRILSEWQRHSSKLTSLDVSFRSTSIQRGFDPSKAQGRLVLALPNLAQLDSAHLDANGKATLDRERLIWSGRSRYQFMEKEHRVLKSDFQEEMSNPPPVLCLPFLFGLSLDRAKQDHEWEIRQEDQDRVIFKAKAKREQSFESFLKEGLVANFLVELDKKTFLPRRVTLYTDNREYTAYEVVEIKVNGPVGIEALKNPSLDGWKVDKTW